MTILFTDPHCGVNRSANTTPQSRVRMRDNIRDRLRTVRGYKQDENEPVMCLGDLFDTYSNSEDVILDVSTMIDYIGLDWCLAGNHDLTPNADKMGSLELLRGQENVDPFDSRFCYLGFNESGVFSRTFGNVVYFAVPHTTTQEIFIECLSNALGLAERVDKSKTKFLLLHCNYDNDFTKDDELSLNLTKEDAAELLEVFDYVVLGHEHNGREDLGGRLIVLGNTYPTSFSDISDKRCMAVNDETGEISFHSLWEKDNHYRYLTVEQLDAVDYDELKDIEFLKIGGQCSSEQLPEMAKAVRSFWQKLPNLIALKVSAQIESAAVVGEGVVESLNDLPTQIAKELGETAVGELWKELLQEATREETS